MIRCIVAVEKNQGIGFENQMPWPKLSGDLKWFKRTTVNNVVVMGSNTWRSLGKALPDRINVVISSKLHVEANHTYSNPKEAILDLQERYRGKDIYIIGGQHLYDSTSELIESFSVTEIDENYQCDRFFNLNFVRENFKNVSIVSRFEKTPESPAYTIKEYTK